MYSYLISHSWGKISSERISFSLPLWGWRGWVGEGGWGHKDLVVSSNVRWSWWRECERFDHLLAPPCKRFIVQSLDDGYKLRLYVRHLYVYFLSTWHPCTWQDLPVLPPLYTLPDWKQSNARGRKAGMREYGSVQVGVHLSLKRSHATNGSSKVLFPHVFVLINLYVHRYRWD